MYGILECKRDPGRKVYEHVMKHLKFESEIVVGKRPTTESNSAEQKIAKRKRLHLAFRERKKANKRAKAEGN